MTSKIFEVDGILNKSIIFCLFSLYFIVIRDIKIMTLLHNINGSFYLSIAASSLIMTFLNDGGELTKFSMAKD